MIEYLKTILLFLLSFATIVGAKDNNGKESVTNFTAEDLEVIENLEMLENLELLLDYEALDNYDFLIELSEEDE